MSARIDAAIVRQQILGLLATLGEYDADEKASPSPSSPSRALQSFARAGAAAAPAGGLVLTDAQRRICIRVINVYETGTVEGDYGAISIYNDGPNGIRQVTYGRAQTTEYGNLHTLVSDYVAANGRFSAQLASYVGTIGTKVGNPPHSPLVNDQIFLTLLRNAGDDPVMRQTQDAFFDRVYFQPALNWAAANGFVKALSALVIYDLFNHSGGILSSIRDTFPEFDPGCRRRREDVDQPVRCCTPRVACDKSAGGSPRNGLPDQRSDARNQSQQLGFVPRAHYGERDAGRRRFRRYERPSVGRFPGFLRRWRPGRACAGRGERHSGIRMGTRARQPRRAHLRRPVARAFSPAGGCFV